MTHPPVPTSVAPKRPLDIPGLIAVIIAAIALIPGIVVFLIGLIPEMNAIWWLGIVLLPLFGIAGAVAIVLGIVGAVLGARRRSRYILSIVGIVLGVLTIAPIVYIFLSSVG
jgi:hypothetical protein